MAEEVLREAVAIGADKGILVTDRHMAGSDTLITSFTLAKAIEHVCGKFDLILCGCQTSDSETAQVGPQIAAELDIPGVAYVESLEIDDRKVRMQRLSDNFIETLELDMPGLATITTQGYSPRYVSLSGLEDAFDQADIEIVDADDLGLPYDLL